MEIKFKYQTESLVMAAKHLEESQIIYNIKLYSAQSRMIESRPKNFITSQINGKWEITFTFLEEAGYELLTKRKKIKQFSSLDAATNCLRRLGISQFTVVLIN